MSPYQAVFEIKPHREIVETKEQESEEEKERTTDEENTLAKEEAEKDKEPP